MRLLSIALFCLPLAANAADTPAQETSAQKVERLTHELDQAKTQLRLERAASRVNAGIEKKRARQ